MSDALVELDESTRSFPGHRGRPGKHGGSLPKDGFAAATPEDKERWKQDAPELDKKVRAPQSEGGGGFTYNPIDGSLPVKGLALSIHPGQTKIIPFGDLTPEAIEEFITDNAELWQQETTHAGAWFDTESGNVVFDVTTIVEDEEAAVFLAQKHGQKAYYNLATGQEVAVPPASGDGYHNDVILAEEQRKKQKEAERRAYREAKKEADRIARMNGTAMQDELGKSAAMLLNKIPKPVSFVTPQDLASVVMSVSSPEVHMPYIKKFPTALTPLVDALAIKTLRPNRVGAYLCIWGNPAMKDLSGEYFTPNTEEMTAVFDAVGAVPAIYHHAMDETMKSTVIGLVDRMEKDDVGLWVEAQIREHDYYKRYITPLVDQRVLGWSSGALPGARRVSKSTGEILRWPVVEASMTPSPMEWRMSAQWPITNIKSVYRSAGLSDSVVDDLVARNGQSPRASGDGNDLDARIRAGLGMLDLLEL